MASQAYKLLFLISAILIAVVFGTTGPVCTGSELAFEADLTGEGTQWNHYWEECVGSGHALLGLRQDWREQLAFARQKLGFQRVRFHGLFDDDMSVLIVENGEPVYGFFNVDSVFDFLVSIDMQPLVELSFMPEDIASGNATIFHYKGNITPPKNWDDWYDLVQALVNHLIGRYGLAEIRTWYFETWNEPNCGFWSGNQTEYWKLLQVTSKAIKDIDSQLKVGGPATCQSQWLSETINFCEENGVEIDFISTHEYPTDIQPTERDTLRQVMTKARSEVGDRLLFYTEYNDGLYSNPSYHDTPFASAFIIYNIQDVYGIPDLMSWWTFTDVFEEGGFNSQPYWGNWGLVNSYGVPKPSFRAFELLHETGDTRVNVVAGNDTTNSTAGVLITKNSTHAMIIAYNYNLPLAPIQTETLCITVKGVDPKSAHFDPKIRRIDDENANPAAAWVAMGSPEYPTQEQISKLWIISEMPVSHISYSLVAADTVMFNVQVPPQGIAAITFSMH